MKKAKIGILTFHRAYNYGAVLQCFALQQILIESGKDVEVIDYKNNYFEETYSLNPFKIKEFKKRIKVFAQWILRMPIMLKETQKKKKIQKFVSTYIKLSKPYVKKELAEANKIYNMFIVGSDQVWNSELTNFDSSYFLDFVEQNNKRIAYAASLGRKYLRGIEYELLRSFLPLYKAVGVREKDGGKIIENMIGIAPTSVLDPTLLISKEGWNSYLPSRIRQKKYILIYTVQKPSILLEKAFEFAQQNGYEVISFNKLKTKHKYKLKISASPLEFLAFIRDAECIFTTSFHGLIYSINFNKPFFYELSKNPINTNSRLIDICELLDIHNREIKSNELSNVSINYEQVNRRLEKLRENSISFLLKSVEEN